MIVKLSNRAIERGTKPRDPKTMRQLLPGESLQIRPGDRFMSYWIRRQREGDVVLEADPKTKPESAPDKATPKAKE